MSHYRLSAPLTGTGTVTVQVPETNTDRTLTLPDSDGTMVLQEGLKTVNGSSLVGSGDVLSDGVYLGGTGSANLLDDYEEGTWTPSVSSGTFIINHATYTKIGDRVFISVEITLTGTRGTEVFLISGLPFTCSNWTSSALYVQSYAGEGTHQVSAVFRAGQSDIAFDAFGSNVIGTDFGTGYLNVNGSYRTA